MKVCEFKGDEFKTYTIKPEKYFNTDEIVKYLDDHKEGKADNSRKIWTIYMFLVWYEDFFGNGVKEAA